MFQHLLQLDDEEKILFEELYNTYKSEMFYTAYIVLENTYDAEDIVHETFIAVLETIDRLVGNPPEKNWNYIVTIVKHKSYNLYNKKKRHVEEELTDEIVENSLDEDLRDDDLDTKILIQERDDTIAELIGRLPEIQRDILIFRYYYGLDAPEIGRIIGKTTDNVRHILMRGRNKLKGMLKERGFPEGD